MSLNSFRPDAPYYVLTTEVADLLDRAADAIETYGHAKMTLGDEWRGFCALGALQHAEFGMAGAGLSAQSDWFTAAVLATTDYLGLRPVALAHWNNQPEREPFEVIDAFRHTAKHIRNELAAKAERLKGDAA
jgi:hypothetical protein